MVQWFNVKAKTGIASLYSSSINLNTTAMYPFEDAYRVQVGLDDDGNIVIQPLTRQMVESGDLDENGDWVMDADLWNDVTLPTDRNNMLLLSTNNVGMIYGIRFDVTGPASGSSNQGRVALRNITFNF